MAAARGTPWPGADTVWFALAVIAVGLAAAPVHARRAHKILGPIAGPPLIPLARPWAGALAFALPATAAVAFAGQPRWIPAVWLVALGAGYWRWGGASGWRAYVLLGAAMIAGAAVSAVAELSVAGGGPSAWTPVVWYLVMVGVCPVVAWWTNRAMVWGRIGLVKRS